MRKMLSLFLAAVMIILAVPMTAVTVSAETDGFYTYRIADRQAIITGVDRTISGNVTIPDKLGGYPVTEIGVRAFYKCTNLKRVTVPGSVKAIGDYAFMDCSNLTGLVILKGVTSIGNSAFCNCFALTSVTLPDSVTIISDFAFEACKNLKSITLPNSVTTIGEYAFGFCISLENIDISERVTSISTGAFYDCAKLTDIALPASVVAIGRNAFTDSGLEDIYYPGSSDSWYGIDIHSENTTLNKANVHFSITDPSTHYKYREKQPGMYEEGERGYYCSCGFTKNVEVLPALSGTAYSYKVLDGEVTITGTTKHPENIVIPSTIDGYPVTGIADRAFRGNREIKTVTIQSGVKSIGKEAFNGVT